LDKGESSAVDVDDSSIEIGLVLDEKGLNICVVDICRALSGENASGERTTKIKTILTSVWGSESQSNTNVLNSQ
jgi:hypothetical protein